MADENIGSPKDESSSKKGGLKVVLVLVLIILNFVGVGGALFFTYKNTFVEDKVAVKESELVKDWFEANKGKLIDPYIYKMNPMNAKLTDSPRRFISIAVDFEMLDQESYEEVADLGAEARDAIYRVLHNKSARTILTVKGKLRLKQEIIGRVNGFLENGIVKNVYFSKFAIE